MREIVRATFADWSVSKEGRVSCPYLDIKGWVSGAIGLLLDDCRSLTAPERMLSLPWLRPDGTRASRAEIAAEWTAIAVLSCESTEGSVRRTGKQRTGDPLRCAWTGTSKTCLAHQGWRAAARLTRLRLAEETIDDITARTRDGMWSSLSARFLRLEEAPADAQRGVLSFAWALGPGWSEAEWPRFTLAVRTGDWKTAAAQCRLRESDNPGVVKRNDENEEHFLAAARVLEEGLDPDVFWAGTGAPHAPSSAPTLPELAVASLASRREALSWVLSPHDNDDA